MDDARNTAPFAHVFVEVDGKRFPKVFQTNRPMAEHIDCVKALDMRGDDVIVCAFAKAGTHWIWEMCSMLLRGRAEVDKRSKEFAMLEATEIEKIQSQPSPRLLNTHLPVRMLPAQIKEKKVKVIHIYRNLKDIIVSLYFQARQYENTKNISFDDLISIQTQGYVPYMQEMDRFIKDNPDIPVLNISYEDTKQDTLAMVKRLAGFLGVSVTSELCSDIVQVCSFQSMKQADVQKEHPEHLPYACMYRKGVVGDWKNYLTVAQSERLDAEMDKLKSRLMIRNPKKTKQIQWAIKFRTKQ